METEALQRSAALFALRIKPNSHHKKKEKDSLLFVSMQDRKHLWRGDQEEEHDMTMDFYTVSLMQGDGLLQPALCAGELEGK